MKRLLKSIIKAAPISLVIVLPLVVLEVVNNTNARQNLPGLTLLFGLMWLLPTIFIMILMPLVRTLRKEKTLSMSPGPLLIRVTSLALIATIWGWGLVDQFPCFLGIPNCD